MILFHLTVDGEDLGVFNLINSVKRSKTSKKYRGIDIHFEIFGGPVDTVVAL